MKLEELIARISTAFIQLAPEQFEQAVEQTLADVGHYAACDRSYVFLSSPEQNDTFFRAFEWCGPGIAPQQTEYAAYDFSSFPWWIGTLQTGKPVIISRLSDLPPEAHRTHAILTKRGIHSALAVPMTLAGRFVGFVGCNWSSREVPITETLVDLFSFAGNIVAGSLDRTRKEQDLHRQSKRLRILHLIDRAILAAQSPDATALGALRQLEGLIPYYVGVVIVLDESAQFGSILAYHSSYPANFASLIQLREISLDGLDEAMQELRMGQSQVVEDLSIYAGRSPILAVAESVGVRAYINAPLLVDGQLIGVIGLAAAEPRVFTRQEAEVLSEVADSLAIGIHQARLYEQVRNHADWLEERVAERTAELSAANVQLAQVARMKDEFLSSMSHELRTPLNGVLGISEALMEEVYGAVNPEQLRALGGIRSSGQKLLALINDILDLTAIEAGHVVLHLEPIQAISFFRACLLNLQGEIEAQGLTAVTNLDPAVNFIQGDARRLRQIVLILLKNAVKFTPKGGQIGLDLVGDSEAQQVRFEVWDTGIGISVEEMNQLFQPFQQVDGRLSRRYGGVGLGLAMMARLVELHQGSVAVESTAGQGSRFIVRLPWDRSSDP